MRLVLITVLYFILSVSSFGQSYSNGFYFTVQCVKDDARLEAKLNKKKVCLANQPIVTLIDVQSITEVNTIGKKIYFDIILTQSAFQMLQKLMKHLLEPQIAFVLDDEVVFVVDSKARSYPYQTFRLFSTSQADVNDVHKKLETLLASR